MSELLPYLRLVSQGRSLTKEQAQKAMDTLIDREYSLEQAAMFFGALRARGETVAELVGFATAVRSRALPCAVQRDSVDNCGTGGDGAGTFNISTAAGLLAAASGVAVAKHGNRAASSRCGSADVLEALGVSITSPPEQTAQSIDTLGFGFLFAQMYHPALLRLAPLRRALGVRTTLNLLGPLLNPARVKRQLVGISDRRMARRFALALAELGVVEALIVIGADGLDELTTSGVTHAIHLKDGRFIRLRIHPEQAGLGRSPRGSLGGGDRVENAALLEALLRGELRGPPRDVVLLNTAALLFIAGRAPDLRQGAALAAAALDSGLAHGLLSKLREVHTCSHPCR